MAQNTKHKASRLEPQAAGAEPGFLKPTATPRLSRQVQAQLGERLRVFYEALKLGEQPVPDRFIEIINRLDQAESQEKQS